jgi:hypothetical protein
MGGKQAMYLKPVGLTEFPYGIFTKFRYSFNLRQKESILDYRFTAAFLFRTGGFMRNCFLLNKNIGLCSEIMLSPPFAFYDAKSFIPSSTSSGFLWGWRRVF